MSSYDKMFLNCVHNFFPCKKSNSYETRSHNQVISICKSCGIMKIDSVRNKFLFLSISMFYTNQKNSIVVVITINYIFTTK